MKLTKYFLISLTIIIPSILGISVKQILLETKESVEASHQAISANRDRSLLSHRRGRKITARSIQLQKRHEIIHKSVLRLVKELHISFKEARKQIIELIHNNEILPDGPMCGMFNGTCNSDDKFRTMDGSCNNFDNPLWGAANSKLARFLPAEYEDGMGEPQGGRIPDDMTRAYGQISSDTCDGMKSSDLPNPRFISTRFHPDVNNQSTRLAHMFVQFGQFLDHDMSLSPEDEVEHEACCTEEAEENESCIPISIPNDDEFYCFLPEPQNCLHLTRSTPFCEGEGDVREQFNAITTFLDLSNIYGSSEEEANSLRSMTDGKLTVECVDGQYLLPEINGTRTSGDIRALDMPGLASMHTLFLREHNRIAEMLKNQQAPTVRTDEELFQVARVINWGQFQNIVYNEWLPILLGRDVMDNFGLTIGNRRSKYNAMMDPTIRNAFSTAAFRFGHTLLQGMINIANENSGTIEGSFELKDHFFNPEEYESSKPDKLIRGLIGQYSQKFDRFVIDDVTNFLYKEPEKDFGSDLVARNIQRARDHGLPGYNAFRAECGLEPQCSWDMPPAEISVINWRRLSKIYDHPDDIDLFTGGLAEFPIMGGVSGATFNCIKARQFQALKFGDRFFFTHRKRETMVAMTKKMMNTLKERTLADVICQNTEIPEVNENVFLVDSNRIPCSSVTDINVKAFKNLFN